MADRYVIDTVAFIYHLAEILPQKVDEIFESAEKGDVELVKQYMYLKNTKKMRQIKKYPKCLKI